MSPDTLRYYERRGLIRPMGRRASGYREYPREAVRLVRFIKRAQALGFTLAEIDELTRLRAAAAHGGTAARRVCAVTAAKIQDIDERVRQLGALREGLAALLAECEITCGNDDAPKPVGRGCPLIAALDDAGAGTEQGAEEGAEDGADEGADRGAEAGGL